MVLTHNEEIVLVAIHNIVSNEEIATLFTISEHAASELSIEESFVACRSLMHKGAISFVSQRPDDISVELTSIGEAHAKEVINI